MHLKDSDAVDALLFYVKLALACVACHLKSYRQRTSKRRPISVGGATFEGYLKILSVTDRLTTAYTNKSSDSQCNIPTDLSATAITMYWVQNSFSSVSSVQRHPLRFCEVTTSYNYLNSPRREIDALTFQGLTI